LAGYTDLAFRLLCRELGAGLCFSEMISCHGLARKQKNTLVLLATNPADQPLIFQIFGSDPDMMEQAAASIDPSTCLAIDINMGCPVKKVVKRGAGSALMRDPGLAARIIRQVVRATSLPVTVKIRSGWDATAITAPEFARMAQEEGAAMVTIHARTRQQAFGGRADWSVIARVKEAVSIPVLGNGDVLSWDDAQAMRQETGCDGIMIGRGALGNPWVFTPEGRPDTYAARRPVIVRHLELASQTMNVEKILFRLKNHIGRYLAGLPGASRARSRLMACPAPDAMLDLLDSCFLPPG